MGTQQPSDCVLREVGIRGSGKPAIPAGSGHPKRFPPGQADPVIVGGVRQADLRPVAISNGAVKPGELELTDRWKNARPSFGTNSWGPRRLTPLLVDSARPSGSCDWSSSDRRRSPERALAVAPTVVRDTPDRRLRPRPRGVFD